MLNYYSTGVFPKSLDPPSRFKARQASRGDAESMYKRNFEDPQKFNFKASTSVKGLQFHHKQYHKVNADYKEKYFEPQYNSTQPLAKEDKAFFETQARQQNLEQPSHMHNWKIVKERKFAERVQNPDNIAQGKLVSQQEYLSQSTKLESSSKSKQVLRQNMFEISRPLQRINNDLKSETFIKNVQCISDDVPDWCVGTNKYYTPDSIDSMKKQRQMRLAKADIMGNFIQEPKKDPNNKVFQDVPFVGQRYEEKRMCVFYDKPDKARGNPESLKHSKVNLVWKENVASQRFEPRFPKDIGQSEQPFIKKLEQKRDPNYPKIEKIGQSEVYKKIEKDKPIQLKIGHGEPATLNPVKY